MRRNLNVPMGFVKHMMSDDNYSYENFKLIQLKDSVYSLMAEDEDKVVTVIMYDYEFGWIMSLHTPLLKETLDKFIELCGQYNSLGDNIITLNEYGIMSDE